MAFLRMWSADCAVLMFKCFPHWYAFSSREIAWERAPR